MPWLDAFVVFLILGNMTLLGSSRLNACVRTVVIQGIVLGFFPLMLQSGEITSRFIFLSAVSVLLKGIAFPWLLFRALREVNVRREVEPLVGYSLSLLIGALALAASFWMGSRLVLPTPITSALVVPFSFFTILVGLFLIISRRKAISQVIGYLVLENGIFAFGVALAHEAPVLVELGILLDVLVGVFVMGIMIFHISREFDHIDTDRLSSLKD